MLDKNALSGHNTRALPARELSVNVMSVMKSVTPLLLLAAVLTACTPTRVAKDAVNGYAFARSSNKVSVTEAVSEGHWDVPAGTTGQHMIIVDTNLQRAKYYIGNTQVGWSAISSGKAGHGTPSGTFPVLEKDADHKSSTYGSVVDAAGNTLIADYTAGQPMPAGGRYKGAPMINALKLTNTGIWMHEGLVTSAPESHGCIRLPKKMAKIFFDNTPVGTPVIIK